MATDHSQNIDIVGKKELGWVVPRVLEPGQTRRERLAGHEGRHRTGSTGSARRRRRTRSRAPASTTARRYTATLPRRQIIDPALVPSRRRTCSGRARATTSAARPTAGHNLDIALPAADVPGGHAGDADLQVALGHRVGLRLRLRAHQHRQRQDLHVARVGEGLHDAGDAEPEHQRLPAAVRQRHHRLQRLLRGRHADRRPRGRATTPTRRSSTTSTTSPTWPASRGAVLRFTYATDPGLARPGWFIDDLQVKAGDRVIYSSDFESLDRRRDLQRRLPRGPADRAAAARTAGSRSRPPTARRPSTRT